MEKQYGGKYRGWPGNRKQEPQEPVENEPEVDYAASRGHLADQTDADKLWEQWLHACEQNDSLLAQSLMRRWRKLTGLRSV